MAGFTPPALLRKPKLRPECIGYFEAFQVISGTRDWGDGGMKALRISEMAGYADVFGIPRGEQRARFVRLMIKMDAAYLQRVYEKNKARKT